ncbi:MAG: hypothetical protein OP8BY_0523 [Candidatus Saccharicenans subterraneus]|uniref:Uncharacterized protein n=1 Tax=Candidatus Saccharicenans subterraneus TaxID=2508984 RepID=A0A3E2BKG2_9BACT|nr:MAG: hypothetical protein OP8BY_0523 [Candidatus Saccharicenans subterraneum]
MKLPQTPDLFQADRTGEKSQTRDQGQGQGKDGKSVFKFHVVSLPIYANKFRPAKQNSSERLNR